MTTTKELAERLEAALAKAERRLDWLTDQVVGQVLEVSVGTVEDTIQPFRDPIRLAASRLREMEAREAKLVEALSAASGYLLNAKIDLETGCPKAVAIQTIEGGLKTVRAALLPPPEPKP